jgi:Na+-driven multidrug efflux pump
MPVLGVQGAAIATVVSRVVELCLMLIFVYGGKEKRIKPKFADLASIKMPFIKSFYKISLPVIANEVIWGFGTTVYSAIYGRMGETTVAAMSVASIMEQTFAVVAMGCGHITTIVIGKLLGRGDFEEAKLRAKTLALWSVILGLVTTLIMSASAPLFVTSVFGNLSEDTTSLAVKLIIMFACFMPVRAFNFTNIVGTLRSGGDSLAAAILDVTPMYVYSVPVGIILGLYFKLPPVVVISFIYGEEIIKALSGWIRMRQYKWVRKIN